LSQAEKQVWGNPVMGFGEKPKKVSQRDAAIGDVRKTPEKKTVSSKSKQGGNIADFTCLGGKLVLGGEKAERKLVTIRRRFFVESRRGAPRAG